MKTRLTRGFRIIGHFAIVAAFCTGVACGTAGDKATEQTDEDGLTSTREFMINRAIVALLAALAARDRVLESASVGVVTLGPDSLIMPNAVVFGAYGVPGTIYTPALQTAGFCELNEYLPSSPAVSFGQVDLTAGAYAKSLQPDADGNYEVSMEPGSIADGAEVTVTAAGIPGGFPSFSLHETFPSSATLTAPAIGMPDSLPDALPRTEDLIVTWEGGEDAEAFAFHLSGPDGPHTIDCSFPAASGAGRVPSTLLQALPPSSDGTYSVNAFPVSAAHQIRTAGRGKIRHATLGVQRDLTWGFMALTP